MAICDGKTDLNDACGISYSSNYQITRDLGNVYHSGGSCSSPNVCTECNDGFYADGPYCRLCGTIDHCNHRRCTTSSNQICEWCDGEIKSNTYWRAYTRHLDNTKCQKACSWRTDSTRCYPGTCTNELASGCVCAGNFSGTHCENIDSTPTIEYNHCKFSDNGGYHVLENDPNWTTTGHSTIWTNFAAYSSISVVEKAKYLQPTDNRNAQHYVKDFRVGVIEEKATLLYYKGSTYVAKQTKTCNGMDRNQPVDFKHCSFSFNAWSFTHNDSHTDSVRKTYYYSGQTLTREFEFHWDLENPYHCSVSSGTSCTPFVNILDDLTEDPNLSFTWGGWSDDLAGLDHYEYDLFELGVDGSILIDGAGAGGSLVSSNKNVPITESSVSTSVPITESSVSTNVPITESSISATV
ncbi:unnamed protein product [Mytilus coruscus]|uniref:EGF-like domain-containing protein n=1 Tax=Mytilus coruscus TaxID=42192 RepID=A0A6J8BR98_MYTCO|nr:unnamed protein product [Mytilus coruscus]